jgi:hypothetical protein
MYGSWNVKFVDITEPLQKTKGREEYPPLP